MPGAPPDLDSSGVAGDLTGEDGFDAPLGDPPTAKHFLGEYAEGVRLSPDGDEVGVLVNQPTIRVDAVLADHPAELASALLVGWLFFVIIVARRSRRRAGVVGQRHCRRCVYQLTGSTATHCPECGLELTPRNRVMGRAVTLLPALIAALLGCIGWAVIFLAPEKAGGLLARAIPAWHVEWLHTYAKENSIQWLLDHEASHYCVEFYGVAPWEYRRRVRTGFADGEVKLGPRLGGAYAVVRGEDGGQTLQRLDLATGRRRSVALENSSDSIEFTSDEKYVSVNVSFGSCVVFDAATLERRFAEDELIQLVNEWLLIQRQDKPRISSAPTGEEVGVMHDEGYLIGVDVKGRRLILSIRMLLPIGLGSPDDRSVMVETDMDRGVIVDTWPAATKATKWTIHTGVMDARPLGNGERWATLEIQWVDMNIGIVHTAVAIRDRTKKEYIAVLDGPLLTRDFLNCGLSISSDGRRAVVVGQDMFKGPCVFVYDFSKYVGR